MELKDFISKTIQDISQGVSEGHGYIAEKKLGNIKQQKVMVTFDVNVTSDDTNTVGLSGKLLVAHLISFGGNKESKTAITQYSRIQFAIEAEIHTGKY